MRAFYTAALYAGARPVLPPADRSGEKDVFNTQILDLDGNNIEVTFPMFEEESFEGSDIDRSAVLNWQKEVASSQRSEASMARSNADRSLANPRQSVVEDSRKSRVSIRSARGSAKTVVSGAGSRAGSRAASEAATEVVPQTQPQQGQDFVPALFRQLSGPIETLLTKADPVSGMIPKKTVVGTALGAAAGAAFAYAMCTSEDGKVKREQYHLTKWGGDGTPIFSATGNGPGLLGSVAQNGTALPLSEHLSRLALEPPPPPPPYAPEAPVSEHRTSLSRSGARSEVLSSSSSRRSAHASSRHTAPPPSRSQSHASRSSKRRSSSSHGSRHERGSSRSSFTLVAGDRSRTSRRDGEPEMELDVEAASVAPSDSISCAGDKYSFRAQTRASSIRRSSGKYVHSWYGGEGLDRIVEGDREGDVPLSARRVTRSYY